MHNPIGIFDSGLGGLTIMRELEAHLPHENIVYFGDTARLPYGDKSSEAVIRYTLDSVPFWIEKKVKLLIVACFTASSHALEALQQKLSIPVLGVIQHGLEEKYPEKIAILGTASTIKSGILPKLIKNQNRSALIFPVACPLFVPLIEEGLTHQSFTKTIVHHYLDPIKQENIDAALLACTHYPLLRPLIQDVLGPKVRLLEPAKRTALKTKESLASHGALNPQKQKGTHAFYVSDDPEKFSRLAHFFFGSSSKFVKENFELIKKDKYEILKAAT